jgi:hypothetical protein
MIVEVSIPQQHHVCLPTTRTATKRGVSIAVPLTLMDYAKSWVNHLESRAQTELALPRTPTVAASVNLDSISRVKNVPSGTIEVKPVAQVLAPTVGKANANRS